MTDTERRTAAKAFAEYWNNKGYEKGESQPFWLSLLRDVLGVPNPEQFIKFEEQVRLDHTSFIDGFIPSTHVLIEQKGRGKDLKKAIKQSDGTLLTPFQQAQRYSAVLPYSQRPRWIVTCNFEEILVYDMEKPTGEPEQIFVKDLAKEYYRLMFMVDAEDENIKREMEVSVKAGGIVGQLYDEILKQYIDPENEQSLKSLNQLCVRLVFCLYAEDAGIFGGHSKFHNYIKSFDANNMRRALIDLFKVLDTKDENRDPYMDKMLAEFPYVNGGLFADENIEIPQFNDTIRDILLKRASEDFDWSDISPTIFGAVFESTLNPETRRSGGMHYTSIENIHKVIDPLFLDDLHAEFEEIKQIKVQKTKETKLNSFREKLASLKFLDPACGSGNFLTETYMSLRRLENEAIAEASNGQIVLDVGDIIKVSIGQFYGIEINDFAVTVAKTALWIAESQMLKETEEIVHMNLDFLPLKSYANIAEGNALRMDWETVVPKSELNYIMGNPPFVGYSLQSKEQKDDILSVYTDENGKPYKTAGKIDYVSGWYFKAAQMMYSQNANAVHSQGLSCVKGGGTASAMTEGLAEEHKPMQNNPSVSHPLDTHCGSPAHGSDSFPNCHSLPCELRTLYTMEPHIKAAFVSTNSITQGEQVASVWKPLYERFNVEIIFAHRTFKWNSEASEKAAVHCVIVGFRCKNTQTLPADNVVKFIYNDDRPLKVKNINPYLVDAPDVFVESRNKPVCSIPEMTTGNRPADGGHLILSEEEYFEFIKNEPEGRKYIKKLIGAAEYINSIPRYCLWLVNANPSEFRKMPEIMRRIELCRQDRLSGAPDRQKLADTPTLFREQKNPKTFVIVPATSSERRKYIPIGFLDDNTIPTNAVIIIPEADIYHFGILTSNVHMAWVRTVCGRLKSDYRYSKDIVYNNFPWPSPTDEQKAKIEQTAQAILDARALYPDCSLADLYDELTMPPELRKAHQANDRAVWEAYGKSWDMRSESDCVAYLMKMYQELTKK